MRVAAGGGGAPRFESCHLRLAEQVLNRATFAFPDSTFEPPDVATAERCNLLALADAVDLRRHPDFRGPRILEVGAEIIEQHWLDARIVGWPSPRGTMTPRT